MPGIGALDPVVLHGIAHGVQLFDQGSYWHAHEAWEHAWRHERATDRHFLKGLIQFAAALHHWHRGKSTPAARLLQQAARHLLANHSPRWPFATDGVLQLIADTTTALTQGAAPNHPRLSVHYRAHH
jgi:predicted metal-dependent hydrolase